MFKKDLRTGMVVELRNGDSFIVLNDCDAIEDGVSTTNDILINLDGSNGFDMVSMNFYNDDLTVKEESLERLMGFHIDGEEYDIVMVSVADYIGSVFRMIQDDDMNLFDLDVIWDRDDIDDNEESEDELFDKLNDVLEGLIDMNKRLDAIKELDELDGLDGILDDFMDDECLTCEFLDDCFQDALAKFLTE